MSSFFGGLGRRVGVLIYGDDRQLQKTLARTETRLAAFGKKADAISRTGFLKGAVAGAGITAAAVSINKLLNASRDAEVVLGQTSVAVKNAGIAWEQNAGRIDAAATKISEASGLDDEDVLRSFQVFIRGQKNVEKSINLAQLAADVARGRYTDLASATMLVNKAAMGQIGALRRAGIQIDKNATATQALTALQKAYGGAAVKYANSAAGAADNLAVAWENLAEVAGGPLRDGLAKVANGLTFVIKQMTGLSDSAALTRDTLNDPKFIQAVQALNGTFKGIGILNQLQAQQIVAPGEGFVRPTPGGNKSTATKPPSLVTGIPARLEDNLLNARLSGNDQAVKAALQAEANFIKNALNQKRLNRKQRVGLKEALLSVTDEIDGINQAAAAEAQQAAQAAKDAADAQKRAAEESKRKQAEAARKAKEAAKKAAEAAKKAAQALLDQGQALKDAALARLDAVQNNRDTLRDLADAKTELRHARMIGGKRGILEARRNLQDAELARKRFQLEQATVTPAGKNAAAGFNFNGATLHFHGVQNVKQLMAEITKLSKKSATQRRGRNGGVPHGA